MQQVASIAPPPLWRRLTMYALSLSSFIVVVIVLYFDTTGSITMLQTLFGIDNNELGTYQYDAPTIPRYIRMNIHNAQRQRNEIHSMVTNGQRIMYMEPDTTNNSEYSLHFGNCSIYQDSDRMYNESYMLPMLQRILNSYQSPINLFAANSTHVILIDCDYTGRHYQDTSMFKAFMVDKDATTITSFSLQTMVAERSLTHLQTQVGPVIVSSAKFQWFYELDASTDPDGYFYGLNSTMPSDYRTAVSFYFPYENATPFYEMVVDSILPTNQWLARVVSTNETLIINGYSGYYRTSDNDQCNYIRYIIAMSGNPVRDFMVDLYSSLGHSKDSWAWVQGMIILTLGIRIAFVIGVATIVSIRYFLKTKHLWYPDVFPTIRRHIHIRSFLLVFAFIIDKFWALEEWVFTVTFIRYNLLPMFMLGANIRSDFLTLFLVWTDIWANALKISVLPIIPTVLYIVCYNNHNWVVQKFTSASIEQDVFNHMNSMYVRDLVDYSKTSMNLWTYYPLTSDDPPQWLMLREFAWFFVPVIGIVLLMLITKVILIIYERYGNVSTRRVMVYEKNNASFTVPVAELHELECVPQRFLDHFFPSLNSVPMFGLVTKRLEPVHFAKDSFQIDHEFLWCSGWVILCDQYMVCQDDLPNIFTNIFFQASIFKVYCCYLKMHDGKLMIAAELTTLPFWNIHWYDILHLSLGNAHVNCSNNTSSQSKRLSNVKENMLLRSQTSRKTLLLSSQNSRKTIVKK